MDARPDTPRARLMDACEALLGAAATLDTLTVRRVAAAAGVAPSMISYHFGSLDDLAIAVAERVYRRLNTERLHLLHQAVERAAPAPPVLDEVIAALVGPSIRWSLDPTSSYRVLSHFTALAQRGDHAARCRAIIDDVDHHRAFTQQLNRIAPWLDEVAVGWRLAAALGIRSQVTRSRDRTRVLTRDGIDLDDADTVIAHLVEVIAPMFRR